MIKELPQSRPARGSGPAVRSRDIAWRESALRAAPRLFRLPGWADAVLVTALIGYLVAGIALAPWSTEEAYQVSLTADAGALFTHPGQLLPGGSPAERTGASAYYYTFKADDLDGSYREAVRLSFGSLTRYAAAAGWYTAGGRSSDVPWTLDRAWENSSGAQQSPPGTRLKVAARAVPALFGALGLLVMYGLTRRLFGRGAAWVATLAYGLSPTLVLVGRLPVDANLTLALGLSTVLVAAGLSRTLARGEDPRLGTWTGLSLLAGLTLASGPDAPPYLGGALAFGVAGLAARRRREEREAAPPEPAPDRAAWGPAPATRWGRVPAPAASRRVSGWSTGPIDLRAIGAARTPTGGPAQGPGVILGWAAVTAVGAVLVWVLVSPALWGWLPTQLSARHTDRQVLAGTVVPPTGPSGASARLRSLGGVLTDPFLTPHRWRAEPTTTDPFPEALGELGYENSWRAGLPFGTSRGPLPGPLNRLAGIVLGALLTLAAVAGVVLAWRWSRRVAAALTTWLVVTAAWLVAFPSAQPDHAAPLVALACLLAAAPVPVVTRVLVEYDRTRRTRPYDPDDEPLLP